MPFHVIRDHDRRHACAFWNAEQEAFLELNEATLYDDAAMTAFDRSTLEPNAEFVALPTMPVPPALVTDILAAAAAMASRLPDGGMDGAMVIDELARSGREWVFAPAPTSADGDEGARTHQKG